MDGIAADVDTGYKEVMVVPDPNFDVVIVGGGINGAGIARDASGRKLRVALLERGDFGTGTSSASTKLIHGGLRYLEHYEFRLVAESLREREVLLSLAPHLITPMRFVLPHVPTLRPAWMMRTGLWLYDRLGGRGRLPRSAKLSLHDTPEGAPLRPTLSKGYAYWDAWVDDARLVIATLRSAVDHGATVMPRTAFVSARRETGCWHVDARAADGSTINLRARALVNAAGPWVEAVGQGIVGHANQSARVQLVKGSHIVVRRVHGGDHAYLLQNDDGRVVFILPYERQYSLIGTTDVLIRTPEEGARIDTAEVRYLLAAANRYLGSPVSERDIVWTFSGVRPLYDDGSDNPSATTRDYHLMLDATQNAPLLTVYGGKLTTYRKLAEAALAQLQPWLNPACGEWTAREPLPGGEGASEQALTELQATYNALPATLVARLYRRHGTRTAVLLDGVRTPDDLGRHFGADLYEREVEYFVAHEWATDAEDVLWRRSKAGLHMKEPQRQTFTAWFASQYGSARSARAQCIT